MIQVWLLTTEFPPYVGGGIGTYCFELSACAAPAGHGYGAVALPHFLFNYRVRVDSMMHRVNRENDIYSYECIAHNNAALFAKYAVAIVGLLNANGPGYKHDNPLVQANLN